MKSSGSFVSTGVVIALAIATASAASAQTTQPGMMQRDGTAGMMNPDGPQGGTGQGMMGPGMMGSGMMGSGMMRGGMMSGGMMRGRMDGGMMCPMMGSGMMHGGMGQGMMRRGTMGQGMMGQGMMGQGMMGQGPMAQGMGSGMPGPGMMGGGMGAVFGTRVTPMMTLSVDDVRGYLDTRLQRLNNKRLKVGNVSADGETISADIVTVDNSLVQRLKVDRHTGAIEYVE